MFKNKMLINILKYFLFSLKKIIFEKDVFKAFSTSLQIIKLISKLLKCYNIWINEKFF